MTRPGAFLGIFAAAFVVAQAHASSLQPAGYPGMAVPVAAGSVVATSKSRKKHRKTASYHRKLARQPASIKRALSRVASRCAGFRVISAYRPTRIYGSGRKSLHAYNLAVDFRVNNYSCAYRVLRNWPHGLSMDGARCRHIHISDGRRIGRRETRFRHRRGTPACRGRR